MTGDAGDADIRDRKAALRAARRRARRGLGAEARTAASRAIAASLAQLPEVKRATAALVYGSMPEEVDTALIVDVLRARGARIALPRIAGEGALTLHWHDEGDVLVEGTFGLREPAADAPRANIEAIDLVIVPGVAFDRAGNRLGMGAGHYDRLLSAMPHAATVGAAFDEQLVAEVPCEPHDRPLDVVITPGGVYRRS